MRKKELGKIFTFNPRSLIYFRVLSFSQSLVSLLYISLFLPLTLGFSSLSLLSFFLLSSLLSFLIPAIRPWLKNPVGFSRPSKQHISIEVLLRSYREWVTRPLLSTSFFDLGNRVTTPWKKGREKIAWGGEGEVNLIFSSALIKVQLFCSLWYIGTLGTQTYVRSYRGNLI